MLPKDRELAGMPYLLFSERMPSETLAASSPAKERRPKPPSSDALIEFDRDELRDRVGGNELLTHLLVVFREDSAELLAEIRDALDWRWRQNPGVRHFPLKGMVRFFEAPSAFDAALLLETLARDNQLAGAREAFAALWNEVRAASGRSRHSPVGRPPRRDGPCRDYDGRHHCPTLAF